MKPQAPTLDQMKKALAQFRKGTKVKERVYHGTGNLENLVSFDPNMTGKGNDQLGSGFYFTTHPDEASGYATSVTPNVEEGTTKLGGNSSPGVVAAHLAIRKPIKIGPQGYGLNDANVNLSHDQVKRIMEHNPKLRDPEESPLNDHFDTSRGVTSKMIHDVAGYYTGKGTLFMLENDMFKDDPTNYRRALHNVLGYDGVMKDFGDGRKHYVAWFPEQVKSAIGNRGTYDPTNPDITMAKGGEVKTPNLDTMRLALNKQGMYSPLEKAAMSIPRTKGTPAEFMAEISKQPGFRKEEVEDRKISLPEQKMTKDEFLGHLKNHPAPLIDEKVHLDVPFDEYQRLTDEFSQEMFGDDYHMLSSKEQRQVRDRLESMPQADHEQWTLPGGENYREVLLKKPEFAGQDEIMQIEASLRRTDDPQVQVGLMKRLTELKKQQEKHGDIFPGNPSHFGGEPGIIASLRLKDRTGPNGEKILHVEEVQSDWHQAGRKKGYQQGADKAYTDYLEDLHSRVKDSIKQDMMNDGMSEEKAIMMGQRIADRMSEDPRKLANYLDEGDKQMAMHEAQMKDRSAVPDAPFKKNWHELALKHAIGIAAKGGYDGIVITPGKQQADRYDLSQHIDELHYNPDLGTLVGNKNRQGKLYERNVTPDKLESYVGKEVAAKIMAQEPNEGGMRSLVGQQLTVGGEGMKGFYDKIIPAYLNKLGKPHGAQVGKVAINAPNEKSWGIEDAANYHGMTGAEYLDHPDRPQLEKQFLQARKNQTADLHYFPITDSMRQQVKTEGLPQYDKGGKVDPIEQMRRELAANGRGPIGMDALKQNVQGAWQVLKEVPGNLRRLATDPVAYIRSLPSPTGEQIMNMAGPGNIGFAGMMIGPKARTWHTGRAQMAEAMETAGRTPEEIWKATGTLKGPDGIWRQEISDKGSTFNMIDDLKLKAQEYKDMIEAKKALLAPDKSGQKDFWPKALTEAKRPVREEIAGLKGDLSEMSRSPRTQGVPARWTLDHPELYAAYPQLADLPIVQNYKSGPEKGSLTSSGSRLYQMDVHDPTNPRSTALHEMQHAIQGIEGMTPGANPMMAFQAPEYPAILNRIRSNPEEFEYLKMAPRDRDKAALEWYRRQHGEAEARATQARRDMSDAERAAKYPYESFDVPREQLLTRQSESNLGKVTEASGGSVKGLDHFFDSDDRLDHFFQE